MRSRFAAAPGPMIANHYSVPWDEGRLCERLPVVLEPLGSVKRGEATCDYQTDVSSGRLAKLLNVWSYRIQIHAAAPAVIDERRASVHDCAETRQQAEEQSPGNLFHRYEPCWITPGDAMVTIRLYGKTGW